MADRFADAKRREKEREAKDRRKKGLGPREYSFWADIEGTGPVSKERTKKSKVNREGSDRMAAAKKRTSQQQPDPYDTIRKKKDPVMATSEDRNVGTTRKKKKGKTRIGVGSSKTFIRKKDGKEEVIANVTAEQLKKTGLSLPAYMKQWKNSGSRPTAKKASPKDKYTPSVDTFKDHDKIPKVKKAKKKKADTSAAREMFEDIDEDLSYGGKGVGKQKYKSIGKKGTWWGDLTRSIGLKGDTDPQSSLPHEQKSGGMIGQSDMSAKRVAAPKKNKKKIPQYYKGGGMIKAGKKYAYGGRVAKYKG